MQRISRFFFSSHSRYAYKSAWFLHLYDPLNLLLYICQHHFPAIAKRNYGGHNGTEYRKQADEGMRKVNVIG